MKPLFWMGSSLKDLKALPDEVQGVIGRELMDVQFGGQPLNAKPLKGLGSRVYEIMEDFDTNTFRGVYTVRFTDAVYVLHVFQKKSRYGSETPQHEIELVRNRLRQAEEHYTWWRRTR
ncbi:MAG TPA: type II toxin-antitoxin system RelE/ParE family toxin [Longimicrobium sp.]